jgi:phosphatidate cytidylyltransferase
MLIPSPNFVNPLSTPDFDKLISRLLIVYVVAGSNLTHRYVGWLLLTPLYLVGAFSGRILGLVVTALFIVGAVLEFGKIAKLPKSFRIAMVLLAIWSVITAGYFTGSFYSLPLVYFIVLTPLAIRLNDAQKSFMAFAFGMYGSIWLSFSLCHVILLSEFTNSLGHTRILLFLVVFAVACADVGGYIFGKTFEKYNILTHYKVAPNLSPNKTYIGVVGYIAGAGLAIWLLYFGLQQYMSPWLWALVAVIIGVFAFVGGLTHSLFKRYFGVKDSGTLIPGHGGIIDRIDSVARVVVILYYFLRIAI